MDIHTPHPTSSSPERSTQFPVVSVCVPTVNRLSYLAVALESVLSQTYQGWELVIGDNSALPGYSQSVIDLVSSLTKDIVNKVTLIHQNEQRSMVDHANILIDSACGDFVLYVPDDDRLRPDCLERLTAPIRDDPAVDLVFSDSWVIRSDGSIDISATDKTTALYGRDALQPGRIAPRNLIAVALRQSFMLQTMMLRRTVLGQDPFRAEMERLPDFDLQLRLAQRDPALNAVYCPERLVEYRVHSEQATSGRGSTSIRSEFHQACLASLLSCSEIPAEHRRLYRRKVAEQRAALSSCHAESHDWRSWWPSATAAIRDDPLWGRSYRAILRPLVPDRLIEPLRRMLSELERLLNRERRALNEPTLWDPPQS